MIRLLLTSGRGPAETRIALLKTLEALTAAAKAEGLDVDCAQGPSPDRHGPASAVVVIHGAAAAAFARPWIGSILWVAASPLRPHHKRKNWYIGIVELPVPPVTPAATARVPAAHEIRVESFRAGGPGGQHQNKTESAVRAIHIASGLTVVAREERSQHRNKALAIARLAALLKLEADLAVLADRKTAHAVHDVLERGRPVKRFHGLEFEAG